MNRPWVPLWILLAGAGLNVFFNWLFIYGKWGAPRMGLDGSGLATLLARIVILILMLRWSMRSPSVRDWVPTHWFRTLEWESIRDLVRLGIPTSVQLLAEVSAFVMATLLIGTLGPAALASHQVAMTCAAMVFMVPLGLSMALTVRMGEAWGSAQLGRLRSIVTSGWALVLIFTLGSAQVFLFFHRTMASWFLTDPAAIALTANLLLVAAAFQVSDALQVSSAGALRGLGDVKVPVAVAIVAYWGISIPVGWWLAFPRGLGVIGVWLGITLGLTITALTLGARVWRMTARDAAPRASH
jgi:MATE family multidrug resistance protein